MRRLGLTPDNLHLSELTLSAVPIASIPPAETLTNLSEDDFTQKLGQALSYVQEALSPSTRKAYAADLEHFEKWGGVIPASPQTVAAYLAAYAEHHAVATLTRRAAALSRVHEAKGFPNPCHAALVIATLRGIRRRHGSAQKQAKPLVREDLFRVLDAVQEDVKGVRDRALLLVGFAAGFRRSELVGLDVEDVESVRQGVVLRLRRSKTDPDGVGRKIGVPYGRTSYCPVLALERWLAVSQISEGPLFRPTNRHGHVDPRRLSPDAISTVVRDRLARAGINPAGYSGHSLRAGFATSAAQAGVSTIKIRQQTGHASDAMLARYVRDGELFVGNAAGVLL